MLNWKHISKGKIEVQLKPEVGRMTLRQEAFLLSFQPLPLVKKISFSVWMASWRLLKERQVLPKETEEFLRWSSVPQVQDTSKTTEAAKAFERREDSHCDLGAQKPCFYDHISPQLGGTYLKHTLLRRRAKPSGKSWLLHPGSLLSAGDKTQQLSWGGAIWGLLSPPTVPCSSFSARSASFVTTPGPCPHCSQEEVILQQGLPGTPRAGSGITLLNKWDFFPVFSETVV